MFCLFIHPAKIQICWTVKLISWNVVNLSNFNNGSWHLISPFNILQKGTPLLVKLVKFSILNPKLELLCQPQMLWSIFLGTSLTFPTISSIPIIRQNTQRWINQDLNQITLFLNQKKEKHPFLFHHYLETLMILPTVT